MERRKKINKLCKSRLWDYTLSLCHLILKMDFEIFMWRANQFYIFKKFFSRNTHPLFKALFSFSFSFRYGWEGSGTLRREHGQSLARFTRKAPPNEAKETELSSIKSTLICIILFYFHFALVTSCSEVAFFFLFRFYILHSKSWCGGR